MTICELLVALGWPGNRVLSSHEYQQVSKFKETLNLLTELNEFSGDRKSTRLNSSHT